MDNKKIEAYKEKITNMFIKGLEEKGLEWKKEWIEKYSYCENAYGQGYSGLNSFILSTEMNEKGYTDNRWFTYEQAKKLGYQVKKGEKSTEVMSKYAVAIEDGKMIKIKIQDLYNPEFMPDAKKFMYSKIYNLFNAHQIQGITLKQERSEVEKVNTYDISEAVKTLSDKMGVLIKSSDKELQKGAYYKDDEDIVYMPDISNFKSEYAYNSTCLHELAHATGNEKRLNRQTLKDYFKDNKIRAQEELVAEVTSAFMGIHLIKSDKENILEEDNEHLKNHQAYINSWASLLKEDKNLIFKCFEKANSAANYMNDIITEARVKEYVDEAKREKEQAEQKQENLKADLSQKENYKLAITLKKYLKDEEIYATISNEDYMKQDYIDKDFNEVFANYHLIFVDNKASEEDKIVALTKLLDKTDSYAIGILKDKQMKSLAEDKQKEQNQHKTIITKLIKKRRPQEQGMCM